jgi:hypothetical protein
VKKRKWRVSSQIAELLLIAGFLCFAGGYAVAGGVKGEVEQYTYGENISVNVKILNLGIEQEVKLYKGMTPFDAILRVASLKTEYYPSMDTSLITEIDGVAQSWGFRVNDKVPSTGMQDYQLSDGDNLELYELQW